MILNDLEDHLRSTKGMPPLDRRISSGSSTHGPGVGGVFTKARRPSFSNIADVGASPRPMRRINSVPSACSGLSVLGSMEAGTGTSVPPARPPIVGTGGVGALQRAHSNRALHPYAAPAPPPAAAPPQARRCRMFIELEQCWCPRRLDGVWEETHHWNWAFEQERVANFEKKFGVTGKGSSGSFKDKKQGKAGKSSKERAGWSQPHLPTISARALVALYEGLNERNVLLDVSGPTLQEVAGHIAHALVESGQLEGWLMEEAAKLIGARSGAATKVFDSVSSPRLTAQLDLSPQVDEEAFDLLIAHTDLVSSPSLAFARLAEPIQVQKAVLVRPRAARPAERARRWCRRRLAAIMLDEDFVEASARARPTTFTAPESYLEWPPCSALQIQR